VSGWPEHLPDWVFWLLVVAMPSLYTVRLIWKMWGPGSKPPPTRMTKEDVIALVQTEIKRQWPEGSGVNLQISEWPRPSNNMTWTIWEPMTGSWWTGRVDDATGDVTDVRHVGVR
jgi:hypothetical protein